MHPSKACSGAARLLSRSLLRRRQSASILRSDAACSKLALNNDSPLLAGDALPSPPLLLSKRSFQSKSEPVPIVWTTHRLDKEQIAKVDAIFHKILWLDLFETSMLNDLINERLGTVVTPKQKAAIERQLAALDGDGSSGKGEAEADAEEAQEGPMLVDLKLVSFDAKAKIKVIKEVRSIAGLGLKEAKELVESAPTVFQKDLKPEQAEELKVKLEEAGATIELAEQ